jgi:hypothetical protein
MVLPVAAAVLIWRMLATDPSRLTPEDRATVVGLLAMAAIVNQFFLRANLSERFGDAVVPVALLAAWSTGAASAIGWPTARRLLTVVPLTFLIFTCGSAYVFANVALDLDTSGLSDSWGKTTRRFHSVHAELRRLPPVDWSDIEATGTLPAARYIAECTGPDEYVFVAGYAPEIAVLARRRFAAGQGTVSMSFYTSEADQRRALARLAHQSVPLVLADAEDFEEGFVPKYPLLARHLADRYRDAGTILVNGEPGFRVFVQTDRQPIRRDPHLGLPCFQ